MDVQHQPAAVRPQVYSAPPSDSGRKHSAPFAPGRLALYSDAGALYSDAGTEPSPPRPCPSPSCELRRPRTPGQQACCSRSRAPPPWTGCDGGGGPSQREATTTNQDRAVAAWPTAEGDAVLGVFDGHGAAGDLVASFVSDRLAELLLHSLGDLAHCIRDADDQLRASAVPSERSGTTAIVDP